MITNGTRLHLTNWAWLRYVDEVFISLYPSARPRPHAVAELCRRAEADGVHVGLNRIDHFRLVRPRQRLAPEEATAVYEMCQVARSWSCHTVQEGYVYRRPMVVGAWQASSEARCHIHPVAGLETRSAALLYRPEPLPECSTCLGTVGTRIPQAMANRKTWNVLSTIVGEIDWGQVPR